MNTNTLEIQNLAPLAFIVLGLAMERVNRRRRASAKALRHSYRTNLATFALNNFVLSVLSITSLFVVAQQFSHFGLLSAMEGGVAKWVLAFVVLDLAMYLWHGACHRFEWLWLFHKVHHSDESMNVSTGLRFHVGELVLTVLYKSTLIVLFGLSAEMVISIEVIITLFVLFHHLDISFQDEHWLSKLIIVPSVHRAHHSMLRAEHDSNYGAVLSLWDRLFGTLKMCVPGHIGIRGVHEQGVLDLVRYGVLSPKRGRNSHSEKNVAMENSN